MKPLLNLLIPYDLYERHKVVGDLLRGHSVTQVLDVGGRAGLLARFINAETISLNVDHSADLNYEGTKIPFATDEFEAVVSLDTLEHVPPAQRVDFLRECLRVARRFVIIAAPFGSPEHRAEEQRLERIYEESLGTPHQYLHEHILYGIPSDADIAHLMRELSVLRYTIKYAGDFVWQSRIFEYSMHGQQRRWVGLITQFYSLGLFHPIRLTSIANARTNRFYLLIDKLLQNRE